MSRGSHAIAACALVLCLGVDATAQAPDGTAVLRAAGVDVPRAGAEGAFDAWVTAPAPVPPAAFPTLVIGMGPVDPRGPCR
jgi:hypothetical protein